MVLIRVLTKQTNKFQNRIKECSKLALNAIFLRLGQLKYIERDRCFLQR